ncbi:MAG: hypothetical protein IJ937_06545, partial [Treponema sp.]|nr:hypothetical protein [Treponema sp.]
GSVRDTLSIADCVVAYSSGGKITKDQALKVLGSTDETLMVKFFDFMQERDTGGLLEFISEIDSTGKNLSVFVKDLSKHARNLLICRSCEKPNDILSMSNETFEMLKIQADKFDEKTLIEYMQAFGGAENELRYTLSPRLLLETLSLAVMSGLTAENAKKN